MSNLILPRKGLIRVPPVIPYGPPATPGMPQVRGPHYSPMMIDPYRFAVAGGGGYGWAPTSLANLHFWWRADAGVTLSGSDVTQVDDQSGNGRYALQFNSSGSTPVRLTNNSPVTGMKSFRIEDAGADNRTIQLYHGLTNQFSGVTAAMAFMAIKLDNDPPPFDHRTGFWKFGSQGGFASHYSYTDGSIYDGFGSSTRFTIGNPTPSLASWRRVCVKAESSGYQFWIDNASIYSNGTSCGSDWVSNPAIAGDWIGSGYSMIGNILEIFFYSRVLNSTERGLADQYLADRISGAWYAAEHP